MVHVTKTGTLTQALKVLVACQHNNAHDLYIMRSARAAMTVAGNACAKKDAKSNMYDIASGAPNPLAHCDMKMPGHC
jgi:hypothetical protein